MAVSVRISRADAARLLRLAGAAALSALLPGPAAAGGMSDSSRAVLSVSVQPARNRCFPERVEVTGLLTARTLVDVSAEREGLRVVQVLADPLAPVAPGQVLARLAPLEGPPDASGGAALRAPVAGYVLRSGAVAGQPVSAQRGPLFQIVQGGALDLQAEVPIPDLARLATGQSVSVKPLGLPEVAGRIRRVERSTDPTTQSGRVTVALTGESEARVGTFARGTVSLGERCGVGVPYAAVQYERDATIVQVAAGDRIETRQVELGLLAGDTVEVRSGLGESDMVVVRAGAFLREGDLVHPIPVPEQAAR